MRDTYILEPWFVVGIDTDKDDRLGVTLRWGHDDKDGGHIRLSREEAKQLSVALTKWLEQ